jgi:hypothetical protein
LATSDGAGYWLLADDGEVYPSGGATFHGDLLHLPGGKSIHVDNIVGMVASPTGSGYLLIGSDDGVFAFGTVPGIGVKVNNIRGILPAPGDTGYVLVGTDGGAFVFGTGAPFKGSLAGEPIKVTDIIGPALTPDGQGYWMAGSGGSVYPFGDAKRFPAIPMERVEVGVAGRPVHDSTELSGRNGSSRLVTRPAGAGSGLPAPRITDRRDLQILRAPSTASRSKVRRCDYRGSLLG